MKKILFLIFAVLSLILLPGSCKNKKESVLQKNAEKYTRENFKEISSFKTIRLEFADSITMLQAINNQIALLDSFISQSKKEIADSRYAIEDLGKDSRSESGLQLYFEKIKNRSMDISKNNELIDFLKIVRKADNVNDACAYKYDYEIEAKAATLEYINFILLCGKDYNIIQMVKNPDEVDKSPCEIPGYNEKYAEVDKKYNY